MSLVFEHDPLPDIISRQLEGEIASRICIQNECLCIICLTQSPYFSSPSH